MLKEKEMRFDYSVLKGRIIEKYGSRGNFANAMGWNNNQISRKLRGDSYFTMPEIVRAQKLLGIKDTEIKRYFFTQRV